MANIENQGPEVKCYRCGATEHLYRQVEGRHCCATLFCQNGAARVNHDIARQSMAFAEMARTLS